ncbi:uncharacterized protein LOC134551722 [Prinia subflava]|uniref:uncharacterized protein LOC134551722 n=1 Tax=Prinia subflava TaxID=208062 RepID=UPI002FE359B1
MGQPGHWGMSPRWEGTARTLGNVPTQMGQPASWVMSPHKWDSQDTGECPQGGMGQPGHWGMSPGWEGTASIVGNVPTQMGQPASWVMSPRWEGTARALGNVPTQMGQPGHWGMSPDWDGTARTLGNVPKVGGDSQDTGECPHTNGTASILRNVPKVGWDSQHLGKCPQDGIGQPVPWVMSHLSLGWGGASSGSFAAPWGWGTALRELSSGDGSWGCSPGEEKDPGRPWSSFQGLKGLQESWRGTGDKGWRDRTQGMAPTARGQGWMGYWELGIPGCEGGQALAQGAQRSCGCPWIPGSVQGQAGQGLEQPGTVEGVPAMTGVEAGYSLRSLPTQTIP